MLQEKEPTSPTLEPDSAVLLANLREMERTRESYWLSRPSTSRLRLRWRASAARHALHIVPGDSVLEIGAGSGLWTEHLVSVLREECSVTAAAFNSDLASSAAARFLRGATVEYVQSADDLVEEGFDHIVANTILSHTEFEANIEWLHRLLRPGGGFVCFEANYRNPQVFLKVRSRRVARLSGHAKCQTALERAQTERLFDRRGFSNVEVLPYDILHPRTPPRLIPAVQSASLILEHLPGVRDLCGALFTSARKPAGTSAARRVPDLAEHKELYGKISAVVPCHNEADNIPQLVRALRNVYDAYFCEFIIVNDNSADETRAVTLGLKEQDPRVRLVDRKAPSGVGRALRDGYATATGKYILSLDADFQMIVPELRDLFDAIANGHDGAIGSRFSRDSVLLDYPAAKLIGNRGFHLVARVVLGKSFHDVSNNLKLYRSEILKQMVLHQDGFAVNAETGLRPLLDGWDVVEVPVAWMNRGEDMGESTFSLASTAPYYLATLLGAWRKSSIRISRRP